jgi:phytanoyl-CoA hydroxylase
MDLRIYCNWCEDHAFRVDRDTVLHAGVMILTCPKCRKDTKVSIQSSGQLLVLPGEPTPLSPDISQPELASVAHLRNETSAAIHRSNAGVSVASAAQTTQESGTKEFAAAPSESDFPPAMISAGGTNNSLSTENLISNTVGPDLAKRWEIIQAECPWYDQPNALELLEKRRIKEKLSDKDYKLLHTWATEGYCIVSGIIREAAIDSMMRDLDNLWTADKPLEGLQFFGVRLDGAYVTISHTDLLKIELGKRLEVRDKSNWRINHFDAYSNGAKEIFDDKELIRLTSLIFDRPSLPDSTLNFMYGSAQDAHQDTAVFHIFPPNFIIGAWIACEDISPDSGPLMYYPQSQLEPIFEKFDNYPQTNLRTASRELGREYREYMNRLENKYQRHLFLAKKGEILLWHGMLLHGGAEIKNPKLTRKSYVIHYVPPQMNVGNDVVGPFNW